MRKRKSLGVLIGDESGAVAVTYALALVGLVAVAGIGYDFARLATMSSELHSAADQAALAAATQLDGSADAITNAKAAAKNLVSNQTLLANDSGGSAVTMDDAGFEFFTKHSDAETWSHPTTDPTKAKYVKVKVTARTAYYALTPIVNAISSGAISAAATAGMGSAICKVPPVMMCNPAANAGTFNISDYVGKGILLIANGGNTWAPGDFGFLDVGSGASDLSKLMGFVSPPGSCVEVDNPTSQPGGMTSVINEFNTRFDIFDQGDSIGCYSKGLCPPSDNSRKDVVQPGTLTTGSTLKAKDCGFATGVGGDGWRLSPDPYRPTSAQVCSAANPCGATGTEYPDAMGFPRDLMHAWPNPNMASNRVGDGQWDINAYWEVNYGTAWSGQVSTSVAGRTYPTRYEVYKWERTHASASRNFTSGGAAFTDFEAPMCLTGSSPGSTSPDRRVLPVAVVNCTGLSGAKPVTPLKWIDVFLVEPSLPRSVGNTKYTQTGDIYVEVIGLTSQGTEGAAAQYVRRDKPFLVN